MINMSDSFDASKEPKDSKSFFLKQSFNGLSILLDKGLKLFSFPLMAT